jgi:spore germination cell wall hydrolase CwlJ-like protein
MNRLYDRRWPNTVRGVVQQPWQFSVWNMNDPNRKLILNVNPGDPEFIVARELAERAVAGQLEDITKGANHYHTHAVSPVWSRGVEPVIMIGNHRFFRL